jgi:uncharacterized protein (DUF433 family)
LQRPRFRLSFNPSDTLSGRQEGIFAQGSAILAWEIYGEVVMNEANPYVVADPDGTIRVGKAGVTLESVLAGFEQGHTPETIRAQYPALTLEEVYGAITWSLAHGQEVEQYLKRQDTLWGQWRERLQQSEPPIVDRLRALRGARAGDPR